MTEGIHIFLSRTFTIGVACVLILSFSLHTIQIAHIHPGHVDHDFASHEHGGTPEPLKFSALGEYLHATEKKLFVLSESVFLLDDETIRVLYGTFGGFLAIINLSFLMRIRRVKNTVLESPNYLHELLMRGILNPKTY